MYARKLTIMSLAKEKHFSALHQARFQRKFCSLQACLRFRHVRGVSQRWKVIYTMKNILIFNDISGLGNCSMSANLPVFSKLGYYCMPVVTAVYSCQTGFGNFHCNKNCNLSVFAQDVLANRVPDVAYVGFCADADILQQVLEIARTLPCPLFVDPIMGDNGKLYPVFDDDYVKLMKKAVKNAFCISPNLTEACLLADVDFEQLQEFSRQPTFLAHCGKVFENFTEICGCQNAVITGVQCGEYIGNIVLQGNAPVKYVTNDRVQVNYSGTGDLFSSVLCGLLMKKVSLLTSTQCAADFVFRAASATACTDRKFGVDFAQVLNLL